MAALGAGYLIFLDKLLIIFLILSGLASQGFSYSLDKYSASWAIINCVSSYPSDPKPQERNCLNPLAEFLSWPSAILAGTETADLLICLVSPKLSDGGNLLVAR
jgi:hypothetical protein